VLSSSALRLAVPPLTLCFHTKSEQKVSNLLAGFAPRTGTGITARRYLKLLSSRRIGRPAQVRRFELRCHVGRPLGAPLAKTLAGRHGDGLAWNAPVADGDPHIVATRNIPPLDTFPDLERLHEWKSHR
jgi:hypothetical protein